MSFSPRRQKELLSDPGLVIVPHGPGMGRFIAVSLVILTMVASFSLLAGQLLLRPYHQSGAADRAERYAVERAVEARQDHWDVERDGEGITDRFTHWRPHDTDGVMEPLWPWAVSRLAPENRRIFEDGKVQASFVERVKWAHVGVVVAFAGVLGLTLAKRMRPAAALAAVLPGAGVMLSRAVYFDPGVMNYVLVFLSWVCAVRLLMQNSVWLHGAFGLVSGLAWLTDSTGWVVPAAWFIAAGLRWLAGVLRRTERPEEKWSCRNHFLGLVVMGLCWFAVCAPRLSVGTERWDNAFFSWPQQWMWTDSAAEANQWARRYPAMGEYDKLPPGRSPAFEVYTGSHSMEQIQRRLADGWEGVWYDFFLPRSGGTGRDEGLPLPHLLPWRGMYPAGVAVIMALAGVMVFARRRAVDRDGMKLPCGALPSALFVALACAGYALWYGWYAPVERSDGFLPVIYVPLMWSLVKAVNGLMNVAELRRAPRWQLWCGSGLLWVLNVMVAVEFASLAMALW